MEEKTSKQSEQIVKQRIRTKKIKQITEGVFSTLFDVTLFTLYLPLCSFGKSPSSRDIYNTFNETSALLEEVNYQTFRRSLDILRRNGFIESLKEWSTEPEITALGKKRLAGLLPQYLTKRPWNGKIYLVNYDFEVKQNRLRDLFREYIKRLGAIKLQESLYLIINNPYQLIKDFQKEHKISGTVLISELNKKGFLGQENLKEFIWESARLEEINNRYEEFIDKYKKPSRFFVPPCVPTKSGSRSWNKNCSDKKIIFRAILEYYSILKNDPQLPYELLPGKYLGDEAYLIFRKLTVSTT